MRGEVAPPLDRGCYGQAGWLSKPGGRVWGYSANHVICAELPRTRNRKTNRKRATAVCLGRTQQGPKADLPLSICCGQTHSTRPLPGLPKGPLKGLTLSGFVCLSGFFKVINWLWPKTLLLGFMKFCAFGSNWGSSSCCAFFLAFVFFKWLKWRVLLT